MDDRVREFISSHAVARLATVDGDGRPTVIPLCFVLDGDHIYSPVDEKPKSVAPARLKRVRNIEANPHVSLVIDDYSEDWSQLAYVLVGGLAEIVKPEDNPTERERVIRLLRDKYTQYRSMALENRLLIKITPIRIKQWSAQR